MIDRIMGHHTAESTMQSFNLDVSKFIRTFPRRIGWLAVVIAGVCLALLSQANFSVPPGVPIMQSSKISSAFGPQRGDVTADRSGPSLPSAPFETLAGSSQFEAQAALDRWKLERVDQLLRRLQHYGGQQDEASLETTLMALTFSLKHSTDADAAAKIADVVRDSSKPSGLRLGLLQSLVLAGTKQTLAQVLNLYHECPDAPIREAVLQLLPQLQGEYRISAEREDLTPSLVEAFNAEQDDSPLLEPLAMVTAESGGADGVAFLLSQVFAKAMTMEEIESADDPRLDASLKALRRVYRPEAIGPLAELLAGYDFSDPRVHLAGQTLARIADKHATEVLVDYATHAPVESAAIISTWLAQGNCNITVLEGLVAGSSFDSPEVKHALQRTLEQIKPNVAGDHRLSGGHRERERPP